MIKSLIHYQIFNDTIQYKTRLEIKGIMIFEQLHRFIDKVI